MLSADGSNGGSKGKQKEPSKPINYQGKAEIILNVPQLKKAKAGPVLICITSQSQKVCQSIAVTHLIIATVFMNAATIIIAITYNHGIALNST